MNRNTLTASSAEARIANLYNLCYNISMRSLTPSSTGLRAIVALSILGIILATVGSAHAYLSPEDVLLGAPENISSLPPAPSHGAAQSNTNPAVLSTAVESSKDDAFSITIDAATLRLLERLTALQESRRNPPALHGGAPLLETYNPYPLAPTGLASSAAVAVIIAAMGYTLWRVKKAE